MSYLLGSATQNSPGRLCEFAAFNRSLTPAEHAALYKSGVGAAERNASAVPVYSSDFSAGADGVTAVGNNTVTGNVDSINGSDNWLMIEHTTNVSGLTASKSITAGSLRRINALRLFNPVGSGYSYVRLASTGETASLTDAVVSVPEGTEVSVVLPCLYTIRTALLAFVACNSAGVAVNVAIGSKLYVKEIVVRSAGQTARLQPSSLQLSPGQWLETVNAAHAVIPSGARIAEHATQGVLRGKNTFSASTTGQHIVGADLAALPLDVAVTMRCKASVEATIDIGDGVDQDYYAAGVTIGTTWTAITLLKSFHDGTNRKIVITPTSSYTGVVNTAVRVEQLK